MRSCLAFVAGSLVLALAACGGGEKTAAPAPASTQAAAPAADAAASAAAAPADFGVPECDQYLAKYTACLDGKVPEQARSVFIQQLEQTKTAWKQAAATPQGKAGLAMGCKQATEAAKTSMAAYGCQW